METMNKIIVAVFDSEKAAFEGLAALKDLHSDGDISLYASSVIAKDDSGAVAVRQAADAGPLGTLVGIVGGSLVGLLGGPAGALVGGWIGGGAGLVYDLFSVGVGVDLMEEVGTSLTPGKVAVVADIDESWTTPVDTRLDAIGATVFRRYPGEVADEQLAREAEAAETESRQLVAELEQAKGEAKAKAQAVAAAQRAKVEALVGRIDSATKQAMAELEARLTTLHAQIEGARKEQRNRIEARIDETHAAHRARQEKLEAARKHAKAALELTGEAVKV
jgi:uncharacterized membrane protein